MMKLGGILNIDDVLELTIMFFFLLTVGGDGLEGPRVYRAFC